MKFTPLRSPGGSVWLASRTHAHAHFVAETFAPAVCVLPTESLSHLFSNQLKIHGYLGGTSSQESFVAVNNCQHRLFQSILCYVLSQLWSHCCSFCLGTPTVLCMFHICLYYFCCSLMSLSFGGAAWWRSGYGCCLTSRRSWV